MARSGIVRRVAEEREGVDEGPCLAMRTYDSRDMEKQVSECAVDGVARSEESFVGGGPVKQRGTLNKRHLLLHKAEWKRFWSVVKFPIVVDSRRRNKDDDGGDLEEEEVHRGIVEGVGPRTGEGGGGGVAVVAKELTAGRRGTKRGLELKVEKEEEKERGIERECACVAPWAKGVPGDGGEMTPAGSPIPLLGLLLPLSFPRPSSSLIPFLLLLLAASSSSHSQRAAETDRVPLPLAVSLSRLHPSNTTQSRQPELPSLSHSYPRDGSDRCPPPSLNSLCPCYNLAGGDGMSDAAGLEEDGLGGGGGVGGGGSGGILLECPGVSDTSALRAVLSLVSPPALPPSAVPVVRSLSLYDLDAGITALPASAFPPSGMAPPVRSLTVSQSALMRLDPDSLVALRPALESLSIVGGRLTTIPQGALTGLHRLRALDLEGNLVSELPPNAFPRGLRLTRITLKANRIARVHEAALSGLEGSLSELDLSENRLDAFPLAALRRLQHLRSLHLAWNAIGAMPSKDDADEDGNVNQQLTTIAEEPPRLPSLLNLDLGSNDFEVLPARAFSALPSLRTLSLTHNAVSVVHRDAFDGLTDLETIDLSFNRVSSLEAGTFRANLRVKTVDFSGNHLHGISGVFSGLPELRELLLPDNNVLEILGDTFEGCSELSVLDLERNAIRRVDEASLLPLPRLNTLRLGENLIEGLPKGLFQRSRYLSSLSLDGNRIKSLESGLFASLEKSLKELRLQGNRLEEVGRDDLHPLPSLLELHLQRNKLSTVAPGAFRSLRTIQHANLAGNKLTQLTDLFGRSYESHIPDDRPSLAHPAYPGSSPTEPAMPPASLVSLQLGGNRIEGVSEVALKGQTAVQILWLSHNKLSRLPRALLADLGSVRRLYLADNRLTSIDDHAFAGMQSLRFIDLSRNKLGHVSASTFSGMSMLEELRLAGNRLRHVDAGSLAPLVRLRTLDLSHNPLRQALLPVDSSNSSSNAVVVGSRRGSSIDYGGALPTANVGIPLRVLLLKNASLSRLDPAAFRGLNNLNELALDDNRLDAASISRLSIPGLRELSLSGNDLSGAGQDTLSGLPSLQRLELDRSHLPAILPDGLLLPCRRGLSRLDLRGNNIRALSKAALAGLTSLRELRLGENSLAEIPYNALADTATTLEVLSAPSNSIRTVSAAKLAAVPRLRELDLRDNDIAVLVSTGFLAPLFNSTNQYPLPNLLSVDLSGNVLTAVPGDFIKGAPILRRLQLARNRLREFPTSVITHATSLRWLDLSGNPLERIREETASYQGSSQLQELHITGTNLTALNANDLISFPALLQLSLSQNRISRVAPGIFKPLRSLAVLDFGLNEIEVLPGDRLRGLKSLRTLNLTHNRLKSLDPFPEDLKSIQILDLSFNQLTRIPQDTFRHLRALSALHLAGNWISSLASECFRPLRNLRTLDLSRNYLESIPVATLRPVEAQLHSLSAEENPLHCSCDSQELWAWLHDHERVLAASTGAGGDLGEGGDGAYGEGEGGSDQPSPGRSGGEDGANSGTTSVAGGLRCESPPELRGEAFMELEPPRFCSSPLVMKLAIQDIQTFSVVVSWQGRDDNGIMATPAATGGWAIAGVKGYRVAYHALDRNDMVRSRTLDRDARTTLLGKLRPSTHYLICVTGLLNDSEASASTPRPSIPLQRLSPPNPSPATPTGAILMVDSPTTKCTQVRTLDHADGVSLGIEGNGGRHTQGSGLDGSLGIGSLPGGGYQPGGDGPDFGNNGGSILTRRLGLIVGSCMGFAVFVILVGALSYLKLKKQRAAAKRDGGDAQSQQSQQSSLHLPPLLPTPLPTRQPSLQSSQTLLHAHPRQATLPRHQHHHHHMVTLPCPDGAEDTSYVSYRHFSIQSQEDGVVGVGTTILST
ncbi:chaoptin-like [Hetaerina americana]|uniref:chaoptin-like n=1 Tax=Hetaerina americana TaxID=62018 RepID=UPI003A7F611F